MSTPQAFAQFRDTPLWRAIASSILELQATHEISIATAPDYVIGFLCQELAAKRVVDAIALMPDR